MIRYRDAAPEDAALISGLFERAFVETFGHLYRPEDLRAFLEKRPDLRRLFANARPESTRSIRRCCAARAPRATRASAHSN